MTGLVLLAAGAAGFYASDVKLPPPFHTPSVNNGPRVISKPEHADLKLPAGFQAVPWADGFARARFMLEGPTGEVLLADSAPGREGTVWVLTDRNKDFKADENRKRLITGLDRPYGMAFWKEYLYVAEPASVKRYRYDSKNQTAGKGEEVISLAGLGRGHWTRSLLFDNKGEKLYVGIGSQSNVSTGEDPRRAAINRYNPDGTGHEIVASGTRNPIGLRFYPGTNDLWAAVQERDALGDDLVPDFFIRVRPGGFYGWPYAYIGPHEDPRNKGQRADLVKSTITPDVLLGSHVAVLDFVFYTGKQFPAEYRNGAFLAFHGSWNRSERVGQNVAFVPFKDGKPAGPVRDFLSGWMLSPGKREVWGRPVGLLVLSDGSLLVSEDGNNTVWRISYKG
ncbi:MAG TPA: PQQ-dependent sugar dehydrogenase [Bryobacteraceae bacterium]|nr:PQQ-dependent sugar dehydrogenase [Bryobacteraceae bacterium]